MEPSDCHWGRGDRCAAPAALSQRTAGQMTGHVSALVLEEVVNNGVTVLLPRTQHHCGGRGGRQQDTRSMRDVNNSSCKTGGTKPAAPSCCGATGGALNYNLQAPCTSCVCAATAARSVPPANHPLKTHAALTSAAPQTAPDGKLGVLMALGKPCVSRHSPACLG